MLSKNRNICYWDIYKHISYKNSKQYLRFWLCNSQKPGEGNGVTFLDAFLAFLIVAHENEWHFWNPGINLDKIGMFLYENIKFGNLTWFDLVWPEIDFSSGQIYKCMSPSDSASQMAHKPCVAQFLNNILIW